MTYDYCKVCNITCCSEYNYKEHINGRKHAENLKRKPLGNATNRYNRTPVRSYGVPSTQATKRVSNKREAPKNILRVDFKLAKGVRKKEDEAPKEEVPVKKKQVFSIFDTPTPPKKKDETKSQFPTVYKDLFKRKKNVNLYIRDKKVFWQFSYNAQVVAAIKAHVPGRQWNPALKEWSCPLESLPIALALYKHMGRTPDSELARRAEEMSKTCPGDPSGVVTLSVAVGAVGSSSSVGTVDVKFIYNAEIVSAIKCLPPTQRSYDPTTKVWPVDLLALPELMDHLKSIGFEAMEEHNVLSRLCTCCEKIATILYDDDEKQPEGDTTNEGGAQSKAKDWKDELQTIIKLLKEHSKTQARSSSSDCGERKTRKLTTAQKVWSMKKQGLLDEDDYSYYGITDFGADYEDDDHDNDCMDDEYYMYGFSFDDMYKDFVRPVTTAPTDCDCGHPEKLSRGRHQCRYYGTFHCCACGNTWTSAYTWKGEKQACKSCNQESYPAKKEPLQSGLGRPGGGHHDTARCSRCRRLGYDCSMY